MAKVITPESVIFPIRHAPGFNVLDGENIERMRTFNGLFMLIDRANQVIPGNNNRHAEVLGRICPILERYPTPPEDIPQTLAGKPNGRLRVVAVPFEAISLSLFMPGTEHKRSLEHVNAKDGDQDVATVRSKQYVEADTLFSNLFDSPVRLVRVNTAKKSSTTPDEIV